jgi:hypothetical protein
MNNQSLELEIHVLMLCSLCVEVTILRDALLALLPLLYCCRINTFTVWNKYLVGGLRNIFLFSISVSWSMLTEEIYSSPYTT